MLSQKVSKRLVGQLLERLHAFRCQHPDLLPGFFVKLHAFADHGVASNHEATFESQPWFRGPEGRLRTADPDPVRLFRPTL